MSNAYISVSFHFNGHTWGRVCLKPEALLSGRYVTSCYFYLHDIRPISCTQINEITPWIDGGLTYGTSKTWADTLRSFNCGMLASSNGGRFPVENSIRLPMANPPPPRFHELRPVSRFFRTSIQQTMFANHSAKFSLSGNQ